MPIKRDVSSYVKAFSEPVLGEDCVVYSRLDQMPSSPQITGNVSISTDTEFGSTSVSLVNGTVLLDNTAPTSIPLYWEFSAWVRLNSSSDNPLFTILSTFSLSIGYDSTSGTLKLVEGITDTITVERKKSLAINGAWHYLRITRNSSVISVSIDFETPVVFDEVYYPATQGYLYVGQSVAPVTSKGNFKIQSALFRASSSPVLNLERDLSLYRRYYQATSSTSKLRNSCYIHLPCFAESSIGVYPSTSDFSFFSTEDNAYKISPSPLSTESLDNARGLRVTKEAEGTYLGNEYAIDCVFKLSSVNSDLVVFSNYSTEDKTGLTVRFDSASKQLVLVRYVNALQSVVIGSSPLVADTYYRVTVAVYKSTLILYLNGVQVYSQPSLPFSTISLDYKFNYNQPAVTNTNTVLYLRKFTVRKIAVGYLPFSEPLNLDVPACSLKYVYPFSLHQIDDRVASPAYKLSFTCQTPAPMVPGSSISLAVTQQHFNQDVEYSVSVSIPPGNDVKKTDITVSTTFTVQAGQVSYALPLSLSLFDKFKRGTYFYLYISNKTSTFRVKVTINAPTFNLNVLKGTGHIDTLLAYTSWTGPTGVQATGSGQLVADSTYGITYRVNSDATALSTVNSYSNVRTIFLAYQELQLTAKRVYVGGPTYTFNGGVAGELIGDLVTASSEWLLTKRDTGRYKALAISANGTKLLRANETSQKIELLVKNQGWNVPVVALNLDLQSPSTVDSASMDITATASYACIGFPNANNAEGVVQLWNLGTMTKDLHLGSPNPLATSGGFGLHTAISSDALTLYVSEVSSKKLYVYRKTTAWSATPLQTITYTADITGISTYSNYLLVSTSDRQCRLYQEQTTGTWSLLQTYNGLSGKFDKLSPLFYIYNDLSANIKLYNPANPAVSLSTIIASAYSKVELCDQSLAVSTVDSSLIKYYDVYTSITPVTLSDTSSDYGAFIALSEDSLVVNNYSNLCDIYTSDSSAYGERISKVHLNGLPVGQGTILTTNNMNVLCFTTALPMVINKIGTGYNSSYGANSLNGLISGMFLYDRVFSDTEIAAYSANIETLLGLQEARLVE